MLNVLNNFVGECGRIGSASIPVNYDYLRSLIRKMRELADRGEFDAASVYASVAAFHASVRHCGIWTSSEIENALAKIGAQLGASGAAAAGKRQSTQAKQICHVGTMVQSVGGLTRMLCRWINTDRQRQHSLVLTRQGSSPVPAYLQQAIASSGGRIHLCDVAVGGLVERARMLRRIAANFDAVVLHIHPNDVVPVIAFATSDRPPVIFLDHADHSFWLGTSVSDVVANMRASGRRLSIERRGIDPARIALLPTILQPRRREVSREEAKRKLGLPEDCVLLTSVARGRKYRQLTGCNYADLHLPTLLKHPNCILLVVGPGDQQDWSEAKTRSNGRVIALPEQDDPSLYFQACDIYVDSFPFVSITSALEAGAYGAPVVSLYPYSDNCAVLGCDMPGLDENVRKCHTLDEYWGVLSALITDPGCRLGLGEALSRCITDNHTNGTWLQSLNAVYELALSVPRVTEQENVFDRMTIGEPDIYIQGIHGGDADGKGDTDRLLKFDLGVLPPEMRIKEWWRLLRAGQLNNSGTYGPMIYLVPEWARSRAGRMRRKILHGQQ